VVRLDTIGDCGVWRSWMTLGVSLRVCGPLRETFGSENSNLQV